MGDTKEGITSPPMPQEKNKIPETSAAREMSNKSYTIVHMVQNQASMLKPKQAMRMQAPMKDWTNTKIAERRRMQCNKIQQKNRGT